MAKYTEGDVPEDAGLRFFVLICNIEATKWTLFDSGVDEDATPPVRRLPDEYIIDLLIAADAEMVDAESAAQLWDLDLEDVAAFFAPGHLGVSVADLYAEVLDHSPLQGADISRYVAERCLQASNLQTCIMTVTERDKAQFRKGVLPACRSALLLNRETCYNLAANEDIITPIGPYRGKDDTP